jgi:hypothetical protein
MRFISDEEFEELKKAETAELLNEVLTRLHTRAIEDCIKMLPEVVTRMVANTTATNAMTKDFYSRNKGFKDHKEIVMSVVQEVESQNPGLDYSEILKKAEPIIKKKIGNEKLSKGLSCDLPDKVNLDGNGVI